MKPLKNRRQSLLSLDDALALLHPYFADFIKCIEVGWQAWRKFEDGEPELRLPLDDSARAKFVHCHIVHEAKLRFAGVKGIKIVEEPGLPVCFDFEDKAVLRFKKLNDDCKPSNVMTKQQVKLAWQQLDIPGMPPALTHVVLGYRLKGVEMHDVVLACWRGGRRLWKYKITDSMADLLPHPAIEGRKPKKAKVRATNIKKASSNDG